MPFELMNPASSEMEKYKDHKILEKDAFPFVGQLKKHSKDKEKIFLRPDPSNQTSALIEFNTKDVLFAEDVSTISGEDGESYRLVKVWVKKGSIGIRLEAFTVADYSKDLAHY